MNIIVQVHARAKKNAVELKETGEYHVRITSVPEQGKANAHVIRLLAQHFDVGVSRVRILSGATHKIKRIAIDI